VTRSPSAHESILRIHSQKKRKEKKRKSILRYEALKILQNRPPCAHRRRPPPACPSSSSVPPSAVLILHLSRWRTAAELFQRRAGIGSSARRRLPLGGVQRRRGSPGSAAASKAPPPGSRQSPRALASVLRAPAGDSAYAPPSPLPPLL